MDDTLEHGTKAARKRYRQAIRNIAPPKGVEVKPPDITIDTILNHTAPTLDMVAHVTQNDLTKVIEVVDVVELDKRITLLARLIIEDSLWNSVGLTKKERADIAFNAIKTIEGTKTTLWTRDDRDKNLPRTQEQYEKELRDTETRVRALLAKKKGASTELADAALDILELTEPRNEDIN